MAGADARAARDLARKLCGECVECGASVRVRHPCHARGCSRYADALTQILHTAYAPIRKKMFPSITPLLAQIRSQPARVDNEIVFTVKHDKG